MNSYNKQINLTHHQPIHIKLWCGSFELHTHPELSVKLIFEGINNPALVPLLTQNNKGIHIDHQSIAALLASSSTIKIHLYVPDESEVTLRLITGHLFLSGSYKQLNVMLLKGMLYANMESLFINDNATVRIVSGDAFIENDQRKTVKTRAGDDHYLRYTLNNNALLKINTHFGILHRDAGRPDNPWLFA